MARCFGAGRGIAGEQPVGIACGGKVLSGKNKLPSFWPTIWIFG